MSVFKIVELPIRLLHRWGSPRVRRGENSTFDVEFAGQTHTGLVAEEDPNYKGQGKLGVVINVDGNDYRVQFTEGDLP